MSHADLTDAERDALSRASQARSELTQTEEAFDEFRAEMIAALLTTSPNQISDREQLYLAVRVLDRVRGAVRMLAAGSVVPEYNALVRSILEGRDPG